MDTPLYRTNIKDTIQAYCAGYALPLPQVLFDSTDMGEGHYVPDTHTLAIGRALLTVPDWAGYYALFLLLADMHLRLRPTDFSRLAQRSAQYRIMPDGRCGRLDNGKWQWVNLSAAHPTSFWLAAAQNMPHLTEVAERAEEEAYDMMLNDVMRDNLHTVCYLSRPKTAFAGDYNALFDAIDCEIDVK